MNTNDSAGEAGGGGEAVADGGKLAEAEGEGDGRATTLDTAGAAYVVPFGSTAGLEATAAARAGNEAAPAFVTALDAALLLAAGTAAATCTPMTSLPEDRKRPPRACSGSGWRAPRILREAGQACPVFSADAVADTGKSVPLRSTRAVMTTPVTGTLAI